METSRFNQQGCANDQKPDMEENRDTPADQPSLPIR